MRILQINPIIGHSSTGRAVSELDRFFTLKDHECHVACFEGADIKNLYHIGSVFDRKIHAFLSRLTGYEASFSHAATFRLIQYIKKLKPDVVKIGIFHSNYLNYKMLFRFLGKADIPTVIVLDDCWYFTGKCIHYTRNGCFKWKTGCGNCQYKDNGLTTWFFDRSAKMLRMKAECMRGIPRLGVVGVSDWITNEAKCSVLKDASIIERIYNWIDLEQFYPREHRERLKEKYSVPGKYVILGVASSWKQGKGLRDFIKLSKQTDNSTCIILVGRIPDGISLPSNIVHIDETNDVNELAEIYSLADVFVSLSREESFGKVSAEALACGTPVVCYDATACPEIVGENCGEAVAIGEFSEILKVLERVKAHDKSDYTKNCVQYARENFSLQKSADEYLQLFERLIRL